MTRFALALIVMIIAWPALTFAGEIEVSDGWARATAPGVDVGAVYMTIVNHGDTSDRLVGASTPAARAVELHRTTMEGDIMRMRPVDAAEIEPGGRLVLKPGGYHLMLFGLTEPLDEGANIRLELHFDRAGTVAVEASVRGLGAGEDDHSGHAGHAQAAPAPIGVMGDHMHGAGAWMLSYRFMRMDMEGNRIGTNSVSPEDIVTTVANPHSGPATLRVVPTKMTTDMHMFGAMYAPVDSLTLMAMTSYQRKEMDHITFQGMMGTTRLGAFTTRASGIGDTRLTGLVRLHDDGTHHVHLNAGISLPTGSIDEGDVVLAPTNARPRLTLPYAMQLGSGTYDLLPGITYTGAVGDWGWGVQNLNTVRLGHNRAGYSLGNEYHLTTWGSYRLADWISASLRAKGRTVGKIDGRDSRITAPVQTADPANYGGDRVDLSVGIDLTGQPGFMNGHSVGFEIGTPVYQNLNGPQMEGGLSITVGWKIALGTH